MALISRHFRIRRERLLFGHRDDLTDEECLTDTFCGCNAPIAPSGLISRGVGPLRATGGAVTLPCRCGVFFAAVACTTPCRAEEKPEGMSHKTKHTKLMAFAAAHSCARPKPVPMRGASGW